jgi:hypothetical protein
VDGGRGRKGGDRGGGKIGGERQRVGEIQRGVRDRKKGGRYEEREGEKEKDDSKRERKRKEDSKR